jgi:cobyrinic acid a,c-diamide synthase
MTVSLRKIPRIVIAAAQSGSGKTTLTCGILAALRKRGIAVQPCKAGPDYIDPGYLSRAAARPAHNLDTWLMDETVMKRVFSEGAENARAAVIEGVMGLYDGGRGGISSTAQIAKTLHAPVVLVINAQSMGDSAAALALGFREYDRGVDLRGVILNRLGSENHRQIITEAMKRIGIPVLGALRRDERLSVSERHLGLLPVEENASPAFDILASDIESSVDLDALLKIADSAPDLEVTLRDEPPSPEKTVIAVARDEAFSFYYPDSLAELQHCGARIVYFSPLNDTALPDCGGLIFGGGFPEMFAERLSANTPMLNAVARAAEQGMPIYAECGGYMYLTRAVTDFQGRIFSMAGVVPARCRMNPKLQTVGYVEGTLLRGTLLGPAGMKVHGHEFHFSSVQPDPDAPAGSTAWSIVRHRTGAVQNAGYADRNVLASYLHLHFAGCPEAARHFTEACEEYQNGR